MTTSFDSSNGGGTRGPVVVTPDRLLTFSSAPIALSSDQSPSGLQTLGQATRYRFRINPDRLTTRHDVIEKYILSLAGYERQDWGNGLTQFQYSGTTGVFRPNVSAADFASQFPSASFDIRQTTAWLRFQEFEKFYRIRGPNRFMYYDLYDHEWEGSLSGFTFDRSAQKPFSIDFQFTFTGMPIDYPSTTAVGSIPSKGTVGGL